MNCIDKQAASGTFCIAKPLCGIFSHDRDMGHGAEKDRMKQPGPGQKNFGTSQTLNSAACGVNNPIFINGFKVLKINEESVIFLSHI
jgi:hypothetical protein